MGNFLHSGHRRKESKATTCNRFQYRLRFAIILQGSPQSVDARRQCCVRNDTPAPDIIDDMLAADQRSLVLYKQSQQRENLRLQRYALAIPAKLVRREIKFVSPKSVFHSSKLAPHRIFVRQIFQGASEFILPE